MSVQPQMYVCDNPNCAKQQTTLLNFYVGYRPGYPPNSFSDADLAFRKSWDLCSPQCLVSVINKEFPLQLVEDDRGRASLLRTGRSQRANLLSIIRESPMQSVSDDRRDGYD